MTNGNNMVELTINGREVSAEKGRLLIDVAEEMGVFVPRFCYHPGMKSVAVCRMCLVHIEGQRKLMPACATPVDDGMVVDTQEEGAVKAQEGMLEFLLINHPLDCPICDRGGECPLQDQTYAHGPGSSRYTEEKRTFEKPLAISDLVVLDRERCVLCWRCVRFSDEIAGDRFIQLVDRGDGTQILNFKDEPFDSYFSGNTIQICPVGALTAQTYRFVSRPWNLETAPSVCAYCSVGCPVTNEARWGNLVRCQALPNEQVNDFWTCDKGRFGHHYVSAAERLQTPLVRKDDEFTSVRWGEALERAAEGLRDKEKIGVIAGAHLTTEDAHAIAKLAREVLGTSDVDSRIQDAGVPYEQVLARTGVAGSSATLRDLRAAKTIVWVGPDPKETLPVLYLHLHTTVRDQNASLLVASPRAMSLDTFAEKVVRLEPGGEADAIAGLASDAGDGDAVVCWGPASPGRDESGALRAALDLAEKLDAKFLMCPPHAGSQGMLDMGVHPALGPGHQVVDEPGRDTRAILEAAAAGELDALLIFGADVLGDLPDADLARRALESATFTIVVELFATETAQFADVLLPSAAYAEREGTFTNLERRLQKLESLLSPPGASREPWRTCTAIARALGSDWGWQRFEDVWEDIRANVPTHAEIDLDALMQEAPPAEPFDSTGFAPEDPARKLQIAGPGGQYPKGHRGGAPFQTGQNWPLSWEIRAFEARQRPGLIPDNASAPAEKRSASDSLVSPSAPAPGRFHLYSGRFIYDQGSMVSRSKALQGLQQQPFVELNIDDAKELGVADGDEVVVSGAGSEARLPVRVNGLAKGCVFVPYDQDGLRANTLMDEVDPTVEVRKA
jgi:NADH-quinone oxidoreductase subunit G